MNRTRRGNRRTQKRRAEHIARAARERSSSATNPPDGLAIPTFEPERRGLPFELSEEDEFSVSDPVPSEAPSAPEPIASSDKPLADLLFRAAKEAAACGDSNRAIGVYGELLAIDPDHVPARNDLALLLDRRGHHDAALHELDRCLDCQPDNLQLLVNRGAVLGALGNFSAAERDLRRVLEVEPTNAEARFNLGVVKSRRGLWRDAIPHLRRAIELDSSRASAYFYLGEALNQVDDLGGALQAYQRSSELRPNYSKALRGLGIIFDRMNRPDEAAQMYRRSRELAGA
jgi:tetratricopeptide (TPR) repeat protein